MLFFAFQDYSINQIAKKCSLAPNGAYKILKKFEKEGILKFNKIANIISYELNFDNEKTKSILELTLIPGLEGRIKFRLDDLKELKKITQICIMFGSYINPKKEPNDLDILFIIDKKHYKYYKELSERLFKTIPVKVHDVLQTEEDFKKNLAKKDKVLMDILNTGIILWGQDKIIDLIEDEHKK